MATKHNFPDHFIDPSKKDKKWILEFAKAAWSDSKSLRQSMNYHTTQKFREFRDYAMGNQSVSKYKNLIQPKDANGQERESFAQVDWTVVPFIPKFRKIALGRIRKIDFDLLCTAIDTLAQDHKEDYFAEKRANLMIKDQLGDIPGVAQTLGIEEDDPQDAEELEIKRQYGYKHIAAMEAETGLKLILTNNNHPKIRKQFLEDLFDFGIGGVREYFDVDGKIKVRHVKPQNWISSYCEEPDFSDARFQGEVLKQKLTDVRKESGFDNDTMEEIAKLTGFDTFEEHDYYQKNYSRNYDDHMVTVLDLEFFSINEMTNETRVDKRGNKVTRKSKYGKQSKGSRTISKAEYQVVYKCKWIVGTDYLYDYGLCTNMKRSKNSIKETSLSFHMFAPYNDQMKFFGVVESMMPAADQLQIAWLKLQNFMLRAKPSGIAFDLRSLENVNIGAGGKKWTPLQVMDLFEQRGDMPFRSVSPEGDEQFRQPIFPLPNKILQEAEFIINIMNSYIQILRDNVGFNEITDGSTPNPKTLVGVAEQASMSTSNALDHLVESDEFIIKSLCDSLLIRMQDAFSSGKVKAYITALGANTRDFMKSMDTDISMHDLSIIVEYKPDAEAKARLDRKIELALTSGQITIEDVTFIETVDNIKEANAVLAYRVKKNRQEQERIEMERIERNGQVQQQSAMVAEEEKRKTLQLEHIQKMEYLQTEKGMEAEIEQLKLQGRLADTQLREDGRIVTKEIENIGKRDVAQINDRQKEAQS